MITAKQLKAAGFKLVRGSPKCYEKPFPGQHGGSQVLGMNLNDDTYTYIETYADDEYPPRLCVSLRTCTTIEQLTKLFDALTIRG